MLIINKHHIKAKMRCFWGNKLPIILHYNAINQLKNLPLEKAKIILKEHIRVMKGANLLEYTPPS